MKTYTVVIRVLHGEGLGSSGPELTLGTIKHTNEWNNPTDEIWALIEEHGWWPAFYADQGRTVVVFNHCKVDCRAGALAAL
jgi:hypothetical protein